MRTKRRLSSSARAAKRREAEPPHNCPLLAIPAELRNEIYLYAFTPSDVEDPCLPGTRASDLLRPLLTCRKIYEEARTLAFSCVPFTLECVSEEEFVERLSALRTEQTQAIRSMVYSNYHAYEGYHHLWLRQMVNFRPDRAGIVLEELSLRPAWELKEILPLISREDEAIREDIQRGPAAELARSVLATVRNLKTLKRINILCDGMLLEKDIAAVQKEFRTEFRHPSFHYWRRLTAPCFGDNYTTWAQMWRVVVHDTRRWTLLTRGGDANTQRSVKIEFRMSNSWMGRCVSPPPEAAALSWSSGESMDEERDTNSDESEGWTSSDGEDEAMDGDSSEQSEHSSGHDSDGHSVYSPLRGPIGQPRLSSPRESFFDTSTNWAYS